MGRKVDNSRKQRALDLLRAGKSVADVSIKTGYSVYTLYGFRRRSSDPLINNLAIKREARTEQILALYKEGVSIRAVAAKLGISDTTVYTTLQKNGRIIPYPRITEAQKTQARELYATGMPSRKIADVVNISQASVGVICGRRTSRLGAKLQREQILQAFRSGDTDEDVVGKFGVSIQTARLMRAAAFAPASKNRQRHKLLFVLKDYVTETKSLSAISFKFGVSRQRIHQIVDLARETGLLDIMEAGWEVVKKKKAKS